LLLFAIRRYLREWFFVKLAHIQGRIYGREAMQANEAFTDSTDVGAGPMGLFAPLPPADTLGLPYTSIPDPPPRNLSRAF
jgi:hypothetical protein